MASTLGDAFDGVRSKRLRAAGLCLSLQRRFSELRVRDFPNEGATEALDLIHELLGALGDQIDAMADESTLKMACEVVFQVSETLEYFDNAGTDQTPRGLVSLLHALRKRLGRQKPFLAWPQAEYNFTIRSLVENLQDLFTYLGATAHVSSILSKYQGPDDLVSFPRVERDHVLMHAVFGHELGHEIADQFLQVDAKDTRSQTQESEVRTKVLASLPPGADVNQQIAAIQQALHLRKRAIEELISDIVSVHLFGPSAIFAGFHSLEALDRVPSIKAYPPDRMRLRIMLEVCDEQGYAALLQPGTHTSVAEAAFAAAHSLVAALRKLAADQSDSVAIASSKIASIAYEWVGSTLQSAKAFAKDKTMSAAYPASAIADEVPGLVQRLEHGLPPNEIGSSLTPTAVDERSAVLAAWLAELQLSQQSYPASEQAKKVSAINDKTLKALEYIVLQREYQSWTASAK